MEPKAEQIGEDVVIDYRIDGDAEGYRVWSRYTTSELVSLTLGRMRSAGSRQH